MKIEQHIVNQEIKAEDDCFIEQIDYSRKLPDFRLVPANVIKDELQRNGLKSLVKKYEIMQLIVMIWQYRKHN